MSANEVLAGYRNWLYKTATVLLGPAHPDLDDLAQEGYIAMWRALDSYDAARGPLPYWLTFKARGRMLDVLKLWGRQPRTVSLDADRETGRLVDWLAAPETAGEVEFAYHHGELKEAIDALTPAQRRYVIARFWGGLSDAQMVAYGVFGYDAHALWSSPVNGARSKLVTALEHLAA